MWPSNSLYLESRCPVWPETLKYRLAIYFYTLNQRHVRNFDAESADSPLECKWFRAADLVNVRRLGGVLFKNRHYYLRPLTWPPKHSSLNLTLSADPTCAQLFQNEGRNPTKSSRLLPPKYLKICSYSEFISAGSSTWPNNRLVGHPAKSSRKAWIRRPDPSEMVSMVYSDHLNI
jgi:hypothetical protein